jgi:hypothetical protein
MHYDVFGVICRDLPWVPGWLLLALAVHRVKLDLLVSAGTQGVRGYTGSTGTIGYTGSLGSFTGTTALLFILQVPTAAFCYYRC